MRPPCFYDGAPARRCGAKVTGRVYSSKLIRGIGAKDVTLRWEFLPLRSSGAPHVPFGKTIIFTIYRIVQRVN